MSIREILEQKSGVMIGYIDFLTTIILLESKLFCIYFVNDNRVT